MLAAFVVGILPACAALTSWDGYIGAATTGDGGSPAQHGVFELWQHQPERVERRAATAPTLPSLRTDRSRWSNPPRVSSPTVMTGRPWTSHSRPRSLRATRSSSPSAGTTSSSTASSGVSDTQDNMFKVAGTPLLFQNTPDDRRPDGASPVRCCQHGGRYGARRHPGGLGGERQLPDLRMGSRSPASTRPRPSSPKCRTARAAQTATAGPPHPAHSHVARSSLRRERERRPTSYDNCANELFHVHHHGQRQRQHGRGADHQSPQAHSASRIRSTDSGDWVLQLARRRPIQG